jgi:RecA/RadA recombinase
MARTKTVVDVDETPVIGSSTNGMKFDYDKAMNAVEVAHKLSATELDKSVYRKCALSTGNLMMDLMMGGGIQAAWNTIWGGEGSCKTTTVESTAANIMQIQVPLFAYFDYEQAMDPEYFQNILDVIDPATNHDKIFGVRNLKDPSKWDLAPRIRYYAHDVGEDFYLSMGQLLRALPDKRYVQGKWYYVFPNTRQGRADAGPNYDKKMYQKWKEFFVEAPDGGRLQMIMVIDSIQAMNPEAQEDNDPTKQLAQDAAMHGRHLKKVRGKLRRKHCAVLAIGQLRQNPGARFQNPEYTPGGNTLKHASDVRQKHASRSSPNGSGPVETEASVLLDGGTDTYKYINIKNEKNKFYTPHTEGWARVWGDHEGNGRGFDPVYDCFLFMACTGRIVGRLGIDKGQIPKKFQMHWPENGINNVSITWWDFKALVLYNIFPGFKKELKELCTQLGIEKKGKLHNPKIRERAFEDIKSGKALDLFQAIRVGGFVQEVEANEEDDSDEYALDLEDE